MRNRKKLIHSFAKTLLITLLCTFGVGEIWAYWYVPGNFYSAISFNTNCSQMSSDNYLTYYCVPPGTYEFKLAVDNGGTANVWGNGTLTNGTPSIITSLVSANTEYSDGGGGYNNTITVNTTCNIIFDVTQHDPNKAWACTVTAGAPTLPIKANFNNDDNNWVWKTMQSNGDETVSIKGLYGGMNRYNFRRTSREVEASWDGQYVTTGVTAETGLNASDYAIFTYNASEGTISIRKANTITQPNYIYFDNIDANWTDTYLYFVIGHPEYSKMYRIQQVSNTKLWKGVNDQTPNWSDGSYYAIAGGTTAWDGGTGWGMPSLLAWNHHSAPYINALNMTENSYYIVEKGNGDNGGAITITDKGKSFTMLNFNLWFQYMLDGTNMSSGKTPAQISMTSYRFRNRDLTEANTTKTISANTNSAYADSVQKCAYRGATTLTMSNLRDGYMFKGWYEGDTEKKSTTPYTFYPNAATTVTAKFESRWSVKGTMHSDWNKETLITHMEQDGSGHDIGYVDITLDGNTTYDFKIYDRLNNAWYSSSEDNETKDVLTYVAAVDNDVVRNCYTGRANTTLTTAAAGIYRFTWNTYTKEVTVTYPNSYLVTYSDYGSTSGEVPTDNHYYASAETVTVKSNSGSLAKSGYTFSGWNIADDGSGSNYTAGSGQFTISDDTPLYAKWTQTVTLHDNNGEANNGSTTATWNAAGPFSITAPTKDYYSVEGYYAEVGCTNKVLTNDGDLVDYSGYVESGKWVHSNATTLYTNWTETPYTITASTDGGGSVGATSYTAYVETTTAITASPATGYKFDHWEETGGTSYVTFDDGNSASTTITATGAAAIKAVFVSSWSVAGGWSGAPWDKEVNTIGNITTDEGVTSGYVEITLPANTTYNFKVWDKTGHLYGYATAGTILTYANSGTAYTMATSPGENMSITTAGAGTYTFTWDITNKQLTVTYPTSYLITMAMDPNTGGVSISPAEGSSFWVSDGGTVDIEATTNYSHYFNGWTSSNGGSFDDDAAASATFTPTANTTLTASMPVRSVFVEGKIRVLDAASGATKTVIRPDGSGDYNSTVIPMTYDAGNKYYFVRTYSTPEELKKVDAADAYFNFKSSTSPSSATTNAVQYNAKPSPAVNSLSASNSKCDVQEGGDLRTFKFTGTEEANVILYFDGTNVWYTLDAVNTFTNNDGSGDGMWSTASNWSTGKVPVITDIVSIEKPVTVDIAHAKAKRIILDQSSPNTGKLTIQANKGLEVLQTVQVYNGSSYGPTTAADLVLESSSSGNASLVFDNSNSDAATVQMYSPATISTNWNWQFMGTPFTSANALYSYYGAYLYEWKSTGAWDAVANGGTMSPFTGYCITQDAATTYTMDGTLNSNDDVEIDIPAGLEFVMANSWSAPIFVSGFTNTTLPLTDQNIYLFNTGHAESDASSGSAAGTYVAIPIHAAPYTGNDLIAPMEGFYVDNRGHDAATITLKYDELVRPQVDRDIVAGPMHAPKRADNEPEVMKIKATGSRYSERIVILAREDFSTGFDNGWDGKNLNEPGVAPILYALRADGTKDAVSAIPNYEGTVVGFRKGEDSQYTFSFDYDGAEMLYLNDLKQQTSTLIDAEHSYTFTTAADDAEARFIISASPIAKTPTGIDNGGLMNDGMVKVRKLIINDQLFIIRAGRMYNAVGSIVK